MGKMTAQKLRNEKQPETDKSDSRLSGNGGILSFRLCFPFSREQWGQAVFQTAFSVRGIIRILATI